MTALEKHKNIGFLSNTGSDPLENHKATKPALMSGHYRLDSKTPFKWLLAGETMMVLFSGIGIFLYHLK